ncbi:flagella basal body P-ring formation protein FlgA [Rosenbergiella nectarea]|uniref:Flagella basal body P-ring formation protein FlgA n=1 Tax=Rosenbergiella nectarea TaxID=988801 RepID=A0A1H9JYP4_9GAMM|nr:flagellar basal body P-ring formation chaperone FlgA [Rosenbergiella nectarea]SEQ91952.1 flagella basal body P-ring formation protein FlgA [Rosenbergiella nectarea]
MLSIEGKHLFRFIRTAGYALLGSFIVVFVNPAWAASPIEPQATRWVEQQIQLIGQQQGWQSLQSKASVELFNANNRLSSCNTPLVFSAPLLAQSPTRFPLVISCNSPSGSWKMRAQVNVEIRVAAVVAVTALPVGTLLTTDNIQLIPVTLKPGTRIRVMTHTDDALQMTLKRAVSAGQPLTPLLLDMPKVISRNQAVTLVIQQEDLELTTGGVALQNGSKGATIRVKNSGSGRVVSGTVMDAQRVLVHVIE